MQRPTQRIMHVLSRLHHMDMANAQVYVLHKAKKRVDLIRQTNTNWMAEGSNLEELLPKGSVGSDAHGVLPSPEGPHNAPWRL